MASNSLPDPILQLFALGEDMADGLHDHEATVDIKQNVESVFRPDLDAAKNAEVAYGAAKGAKDTFSTNLRIADSNARAFIKATRAVLAQKLGENWNAAWEPTGFPNQSTAVPTTQDERLTLCNSLDGYFTANPANEVPPMDVTAANAATRFVALSDARKAYNNGASEATTRKQARDVAVAALKTRMRGLISELDQLLDDDSPMWDAFGLNAPGAPSTPEVPEALLVLPGVAGTILVDWADARRAARYRVWIQVLTVDDDFRAVATVTDSDATVNTLPSGKTVRVRVTAVNDAGESLPSTVVELVVP